jgi:apolipoprotein N-acyltransferase
MMRMFAAVAVTAIAFALYARVEWPWFVLGWCGLVPWLAALDRVTTLRGTLAAGLLMSAAFTLAVFWWFVAAVAGYAEVPWGVGLAVVLLAAPLIQPQFIVFALARQLARGRGAGPWRTALIGATAYVGAEWALPKLFADTIGHGFLASPLLRQAADLTGAHGLTFVLLIANECILRLRRATRGVATDRIIPAVAVLASMIASLACYGTVRLRQLAAMSTDAQPLVAAVVQADISHYDRLAAKIGTYDAVRLILDTHIELSDQVLARARPDLLVWPETVYPTTFGTPKSPDGAAFDREIEAFVRRTGVPLVFGSYDSDGTREYNVADALAPAGDDRLVLGSYRKAQLFPFTERVPPLLDLAPVRARLPWLGTWQSGTGPRLLDVRLASGRVVRIAPLICYDAVNPALALAAARDGAELIVTLSNDSWFASGGGPRLHLVVSAFRSIETRRPQVRATNTGISALIDASGELRDTLAVHERGTLAGAVRPAPARWTLMLAWGDWFGPASLAAVLVLAATTPRRRA